MSGTPSTAGGIDSLLPWLRALTPEVRASLQQPAARAQRLYGDWYAGFLGDGTQAAAVRSSAAMPGRPSLEPLLRAAALATGVAESFWLALQAGADGHCLAARRDGLGMARWLAGGEFVNLSRPGVPPAPGEALAVINRLQWVDEETGYWVARSPQAEPPHPLFRVYWSVSADNAAALVHALLPVLDGLKCSWSVKCPSQAEVFVRRDALVLYLPQAAWRRARPRLLQAAMACRSLLRDDCVPLAFPFATGVVWAESDSAEESFGQARCRLLSAALAPWFGPPGASGAVAARDVRAAVSATFRSAGLDPQRPWRAARTPNATGVVPTPAGGAAGDSASGVSLGAPTDATRAAVSPAAPAPRTAEVAPG